MLPTYPSTWFGDHGTRVSYLNVSCFHLTSGHLVVDLCCYDDADIYDYLDYDARLSENYMEKVKATTSKSSVRRYVLPLELDEKVDILSLEQYNYV